MDNALSDVRPADARPYFQVDLVNDMIMKFQVKEMSKESWSMN